MFDLPVDYRQDVRGYDVHGRPFHGNPRTIAFAPTCRWEGQQDRDRLRLVRRVLRRHLARTAGPAVVPGIVP
ncbi:hypothetical protein ACFWP3_10940 [Streptomyces sp. NPDC058525]|uniref:hypothetical protein n=1 Tax=unclassified Streptomyces TaxID=2593676 RepID=UPI0036689DAB